MAQVLRAFRSPLLAPERLFCVRTHSNDQTKKKTRVLRSLWPSSRLFGAFGALGQTVRAPFSVYFRSFSGLSGRVGEKRPTCNPYAPWRADCVSRRPRGTRKSSENRSGSVSRTTVRKDRSEKASRERPGALFDRSGSIWARFWLQLGVFWELFRFPGVSWGAPGTPRLTPDHPGGAPDPPGAIWGRFWLRFASIFARFWSFCWFVLVAFVRLSFVFAAFVFAFVPWCVPSFVYARTCAP